MVWTRCTFFILPSAQVLFPTLLFPEIKPESFKQDRFCIFLSTNKIFQSLKQLCSAISPSRALTAHNHSRTTEGVLQGTTSATLDNTFSGVDPTPRGSWWSPPLPAKRLPGFLDPTQSFRHLPIGGAESPQWGVVFAQGKVWPPPPQATQAIGARGRVWTPPSGPKGGSLGPLPICFLPWHLTMYFSLIFFFWTFFLKPLNIFFRRFMPEEFSPLDGDFEIFKTDAFFFEPCLCQSCPGRRVSRSIPSPGGGVAASQQFYGLLGTIWWPFRVFLYLTKWETFSACQPDFLIVFGKFWAFCVILCHFGPISTL